MTDALAINLEAPCWLFLGAKRKGYGYLYINGKSWTVHRYMWTEMRGPIPDGMELDHLCGVKHCLNPQHMELVSHRTHMRRHATLITHCPKGHPYTTQNSAIYGTRRLCRTCYRAAQTIAYHRAHPEARYDARYNRAPLI